MNKITMIDYGMGNIFSTKQALEKCGATVHLSNKPQDILDAEKLILPGVGAFGAGMKALEERNLINPIKKYALEGRTLLGICLGMQMLFEVGHEFGSHSGLGLIPGAVTRISGQDEHGAELRVPQIGWNTIFPENTADWHTGIFQNLSLEKSFVYFVHSYVAHPKDPADVLAYCKYGDQKLVAAIQRGNIYGCQFHPERSGEIGLKIIKNFVELRT